MERREIERRREAEKKEKTEEEAWEVDQLLKSRLFHEKLHEWGMLEIAKDIEGIKGEDLDWDRSKLCINEKAWNKVIHRGVMPVKVFANPQALMKDPRRISYYRMLSMLSQKSMQRIGLDSKGYEERGKGLTENEAFKMSSKFNVIVSDLIKDEKEIDAQEFDLWRGMGAGTQAQGSWNNIKGEKEEYTIKELIISFVNSKDLTSQIKGDQPMNCKIILKDDRVIELKDEPDVRVRKQSTEKPSCSAEIKGGIDTAGVLERFGKAEECLKGEKRRNEKCTTVLIIRKPAITDKFKKKAKRSEEVDHWFTVEEIKKEASTRERFLRLLGI